MQARNPSNSTRTPRTNGSKSLGEPGRMCADCNVRALSLCAPLDDEELRGLERLGQQARFAAKETLFSEDGEAAAVFSLTEGVARLYKLLPDGRRQIIGFALPGDFLGMALADRYSFSADAVTPIVACRFPKESFARFVETRPSMLRRMTEFETRELNLARNQMLLLGCRSAEQKVALFLIGWRDRLARLGDVSKTMPLPMKRRDIADFLGLTIETVSRTFARLEREKVIVNVPKGIRVLNAARAEALAWT
jgi:CRP/FNR family transcriptional regulator